MVAVFTERSRKSWSRFEWRLSTAHVAPEGGGRLTIHHTCSSIPFQPTKLQLDKNPCGLQAKGELDGCQDN